jgi:hypothetical protein
MGRATTIRNFVCVEGQPQARAAAEEPESMDPEGKPAKWLFSY